MSVAVSARLTAEQFAKRYVNVPFCELERGEVQRLSPGGLSHSRPSLNAAFLLESWARRTKRGRVFANEAGLITERDPDTVRGADGAYFSYDRLPKRRRPAGFSSIPPELVVEVVGKGQGWKKMVEKAGEYFAMGVDRVWILDPKARTLQVFEPEREPRTLRENQVIHDDVVLPGFSCKVAKFFED